MCTGVPHVLAMVLSTCRRRLQGQRRLQLSNSSPALLSLRGIARGARFPGCCPAGIGRVGRAGRRAWPRSGPTLSPTWTPWATWRCATFAPAHDRHYAAWPPLPKQWIPSSTPSSEEMSNRRRYSSAFRQVGRSTDDRSPPAVSLLAHAHERTLCLMPSARSTTHVSATRVCARPPAQAIQRIAEEERATLFVPVSIAQFSVYEALAAQRLARIGCASCTLDAPRRCAAQRQAQVQRAVRQAGRRRAAVLLRHERGAARRPELQARNGRPEGFRPHSVCASTALPGALVRAGHVDAASNWDPE